MIITKEGLQKLTKELEYLKTTKRKELADRLRTAIAHGDLSENFDYSDAKEQQRMLEQRIRELEHMVADAKVVSATSSKDTVQIESTVSVEVLGEKLLYVITDPQLANPAEGKISAESPLGAALLGAARGDAVEVQTPKGVQKYKILNIS